MSWAYSFIVETVLVEKAREICETGWRESGSGFQVNCNTKEDGITDRRLVFDNLHVPAICPDFRGLFVIETNGQNAYFGIVPQPE